MANASSFINRDLLNFTGVSETSIEELQKKYEESGFKYMKRHLKLLKARRDAYDPEKCDMQVNLLLLHISEVDIVVDKLAVYERFLELVTGIQDGSPEEQESMDLSVQVISLKGLYSITSSRYEAKLKSIDIEKDSEESPNESNTDNLEKESEESPNEETREQPKDSSFKNLLPMETPAFARGIDRRSNFVNRLNTIDVNGTEAIDTTIEDNAETITGENNKASTPVKPNNGVRFSGVVSNRTISDYSTMTENENTWMFVEPSTKLIQEISLVEDLQAISTIVSKKVGQDLTDLEITSLDKRERMTLKELKVNIETKSTNLPDSCNEGLKDESVKAFRAATRWLKSLDDLLCQRDLHLDSERKYIKPLELPPFTGISDSRSNIYDFFTNYAIVSRDMSSSDKANFLFQNYLSDDVKSEVRHIRTNFVEMKVLLIRKYGNINYLLSHKRVQIKRLKAVTIRSPEADKIKYVKSFCEILEQIRSLVDMNVTDFPALKVEAFSHSNVTEIAKLLPDFLFRIFRQQYVNQATKKDQVALEGQETFNILIDLMKRNLKELEFTAELYFDGEEVRENKTQPIRNRVLAFDTSEEKSKERVPNKNSAKPFEITRYFGAPCLGHRDTKKKVKECLMGQCSAFLTMKPSVREAQAEKKGVCKVCLLFPCKKKQTNDKCLLVDALPAGIICKECKDVNILKNVLLCSAHINTGKEGIMEAIQEFLPGFKKNTEIEMMFMESVFKLGVATVPNPTRKNDKAFNLETGGTVLKSEVFFKTRQDSSCLAIYPMQTVNVKGEHVQILYDSGALGEMIKQDLAERLELTILDEKGQSYTVAGGQTVHSKCALYEWCIGPNDRGDYHSFPLLGVEKISSVQPEVDLTDVVQHVERTLVSFPESKEVFPEKIGGKEIDVIIGIRQSHLFPTREYVFDDGLQVWRSPIRDIYNSNIVFAGPIEVVKKAYNHFGNMPTFFQENIAFRQDLRCPIEQFKVKEDFVEDFEVDVEDSIPGQCHYQFFDNICNERDYLKAKPLVRSIEKAFDDQESAGATVDFKCSDCVDCPKCKQGDKLRQVSMKEIAEDALIYDSVEVNVKDKVTTCSYPFTEPPQQYLTKLWNGRFTNIDMARARLRSQRNKPAEARASMVLFNKELYERGFVAPLKEFPENIQKEIKDSVFKHFFCWGSVERPDSLSTPYRIVTDPTVSGFNSIIAKGSSCLTNLFRLIISWRSHRFAFTSDISKMFNSLKLNTDMLKYSLYLFSPSLDPKEDVEIWVNRTLMYGVKSAPNQATHATKKTADIKKDEYPLAHTIVHRFTYMDDSGSGGPSREVFDEMINQLESMLGFGGFKIKVVTKSGEKPSAKASNGNESTTFAGYRWKPERDILMFKEHDINFHALKRGIKRPNPFPIETEDDLMRLVKDIRFTKKNLMGRVLELFDLIGIFEPIRVKFKLDLHSLPNDLDAVIPEDQRDKWIENLKLMFRCQKLECDRSVIPEGVANPDDLHLIVTSDAAQQMCGVAIYVRTQLKDGTISVKLLTARSRSSYSTIPRNELSGCVLAAETAFTVMSALGERITKVTFLTDSSIALAWIANGKAKLKQYVHSRVQQIHRLVGSDRFYLIAGELNPSDLLTRGTATIDDVKPGTFWQNGKDWMTLPYNQMPIRSYSEVCASMSPEHIADMKREVHPEFPVFNYAYEDIPSTSCYCVDDLTNYDSCDATIIEGYEHNANTEDISIMKLKEKEIPKNDISINDDTRSVVNYDDLVRQVETNIELDETVVNLEDSPTVIDDAASNTDDLPILKVDSKKNEQVVYPVDFIQLGFKKAFTRLAYVMRFKTKLRHEAHLSKKIDEDPNCKLCLTRRQIKSTGFARIAPKNPRKDDNKIYCSPLDFFNAWQAICQLGTAEVRGTVQESRLKEYTEIDGVLYGAGRLSYPAIRVETIPKIHEVDFFQPLFTVTSVVTYAIVQYVHWELCTHSGVERTVLFVLKIIHVPRIQSLVKYIRESCPRCRYLLKKHYIPFTGSQSAYSLMQAPPFFASMVDVAGTFAGYDSVKKRVTKPCYFLLQVCLITGCTNIGVLEDLSVTSVILALTRSASRHGWCKYLVLDNQSSFKALQNAEFCYKDLAGNLWDKQKMILDFSSPLGHNERGRIESKVKVLKQFIEKAGETKFRHSFLQWETIGLNIASMINSMPVTVNQDDRANTMSEFGLICPNMFLLGRNSNRAPEKFVTMTHNPAKALKDLAETNQRLSELLGTWVHKFIPGKRFTEARPPEYGDIVLFVMKEAERTRLIGYKYGRVIQTYVQGRLNKVLIEYRNHDEVVMRNVQRNIKDLVLIVATDEIPFNTKEHQLAAKVQQKYL